MANVTVRFFGGPWGGESREYPQDQLMGRYLRVLSHTRIGRDFGKHDMPPIYSTLEEEYELEPDRWETSPARSTVTHYRAIWKHPQEKILRENRELKDQVARLERDREAICALRTLSAYLKEIT